jgi:hypothetical protein
MPGGDCYENWQELLFGSINARRKIKKVLIRRTQLFEKSCTKNVSIKRSRMIMLRLAPPLTWEY